ncbi:lytic polysaccharide monooxygenase [Actinoplanes sp. RD1]|uniref:lytic polysaccharide monooxygenase n=1 Tax=Actinoplanes sp. RD1 TaxID=3064538 RepID=UPI002741035F|nr:lytic polysaccharide monooxygenase [Actinoplanes sp. RD1]
MRRSIGYPLAALGAIGSTLAVSSPALAHGYVSGPPSRQANCASGAVANCGQIQFEPQSVEGPKGLKSCDGGLSQFSVLSDESKNWPAKSVGKNVTFTWVMTARHRTSNWEYFVDGKKVATVDGGNAQPDAVVTHNVDLSAFPGRQTVLAVWNIGDTANAFYSCVDLNVGGGSSTAPAPAPSPTPSRSSAPTTAPTAAPSSVAPSPSASSSSAPTGSGSGSGSSSDWAPGVAYKTGDIVTYEGKKYECRQAHSSLRSWEPSIYTLALWLPR